MKKLLTLFVFIPVMGIGQQSGVFLELAGSGGLGSLNYERSFYQKNIQFSYRIGTSIAPINQDKIGIVFPLMLNVLAGKTAHKMEAGIGQGATVTTTGFGYLRGVAALGYRFQDPQKHLFYRIAYTPLISYIRTFQIQHWAGISIGYLFLKKNGD